MSRRTDPSFPARDSVDSSIAGDRRRFLGQALAVGAAGLAPALLARNAFAADPIYFHTWSAAVDTVKSHVAGFEGKTGLKVAYSNSPWAQYREAMITKFVSKAPIDVMWVSDAWLPEWAEAQWLAPINNRPELMKYNADTDDFCLKSMTHKGRQYGLTYYTDFMTFVYDDEKLKKAGISAPPATWDEVVEQSLKIKKAGLAEYPLMLCLAQESWQIEYLSTLVYSFGCRMTDDKGNALMADAKRGELAALKWAVDAVQKHKIVSPAAVELGELAGLKAFSAGNHAFALMPKYRLRGLSDPKQTPIAGRVKMAMMPKGGPNGTGETVGWMRFYGITARAAADKTRFDNAARLVEWFGGKADGEYRMQKLLLNDLGLGFGAKSMFSDPQVQKTYQAFADVALVQKQQQLARKKDVISEWFGEWNDLHGSSWQAAVIGKSTPEAALKRAHEFWGNLKKTSS
jgi:multiple sugar transport system substrate-binding protein